MNYKNMQKKNSYNGREVMVMKLIDNRSQRDFARDIRRIKKLRIKTFTEYYRMYAVSETAILFALTLLSFALYFFSRRLAIVTGEVSVQCLCLVAYAMTWISPALMLGSIYKSGFCPYLYRKLQFERMVLELVCCRDYHGMDFIFDKYGENVISSASAFSRRFLKDLQAYCAEEAFVGRFGDIGISRARLKDDVVRIELADRMRTCVSLPIASCTQGNEQALILTNVGVILQKVA